MTFKSLHLQAYLAHVCSLSEKDQDRYYDIIESLQFVIDNKCPMGKIDFEFQNMCDFFEETDYDDMDVVFDMWKEVIDNSTKKV